MAENQVGVKTRALTGAHHTEEDAGHQQTPADPEIVPDQALAEAPTHRKVLLEDKNISPKTQKAFEQLCEKYDDIISKNSGDIGKTMLVEMEIDTRNHPP